MRLSTDKKKTVHIPNDPDNGYIIIRKLSDDEMDKSEADSVIINILGANSGVTINPYEKENSVATKCLKGWDGIFDIDGTPLKFGAQGIEKSKGMSIEIDGKKIRFFKWVFSEHEKFRSEVEKEMLEAEGN